MFKENGKPNKKNKPLHYLDVLGVWGVTDYAIGDVQGCYDPLQRLLEKIHYQPGTDRLWFVGDLVNRGPRSLDVLRFIRALPSNTLITLGNHDLHLLSHLFGNAKHSPADDTIAEILEAPDAADLGHWLRAQPLVIHDSTLNIVLSHAGINPLWTLEQAKTHAQILHEVLIGPDYVTFLSALYGNEQHVPHPIPALPNIQTLRGICNAFTRMRFCHLNGELDFRYKGALQDAPSALCPWYALPQRIDIAPHIIFGHWAALKGQCPHPRIHAIDTGCVWGGALTALRLQDKHRFTI